MLTTGILAAIVLTTLADCGHFCHDGWAHVIRMILYFHLFDDLFDRISIGLFKLNVSIFQDIERTILCNALFCDQFIYLM
jgi:hypothetical protein